MNGSSLIDVFAESLAVAGGATALAVGGGCLVALAMAGGSTRVRRLWTVAGLLVLALPGFFVAGMWMERVGFAGAWRLGSGEVWARALPPALSAWVLGLLHWPIAALLVAGAWDGLDRRWVDACPELGGNTLLRHVLWPRARPALVQAAAWIGMLCLGNFAVPALFQARVWPAEVWVDFSTRFDAVGALLKSLVPAALVLGLLRVASRRPPTWPARGAPGTAWLGERLGRGWRLGSRCGAAALVGLSAGFPLLELALQPRTWTELGPAWTSAAPAAVRSLGYAAGGATLALLLGIRGASSRWGWASAITWALPGILVGLALAKVGEWTAGTGLRDTPALVLAALACRYLFVGWFVARRVRQEADPRLRDWVVVQGGGRRAIWRHVEGPSGARTLAAGWWVVYVLCLWDVESLILLAPPGGDSLAMMIFNLLHYGHNAQVSALSLLLAVLALLPWAVWAVARRLPRHNLPGGRGTFAALPFLLLLALPWVAGCSRGEPSGSSARLDSTLFERVEVIGTKGTGPGQFLKPRSVAVDAAGDLFAVDMTGRVQRFGPDGGWKSLWQMPETTKGKAKGMAAAPGGGVLVVEPHYHRVNHYAPDGNLLARWGRQGTNGGDLGFPRAIAIASAPGANGDCYLTEYGVVERVQRFSADGGKFLGAFGTAGTGPGQLNRAEGIGVDREGRVYVADSCNHRIQVFDAQGTWLRSHGRAGQGPGEFSYPYDVRVDDEGRQYVCEFGNSRVQVLDARDRTLELIGGPGSAPGRMNNPWSLCLDARGNLYVADSLNHRLLKFVRRNT